MNVTTNLTSSEAEIQEGFKEKSIKIWTSTKLYVYYAVGIILLIVIIIVAIILVKKGMSKIKRNDSPSYSGKKTTEDIKINKDSRIEKELEEAQKKIKEAQETIDKINHRESRLTEAEKRFEEAKRELEKAKKGF